MQWWNAAGLAAAMAALSAAPGAPGAAPKPSTPAAGASLRPTARSDDAQRALRRQAAQRKRRIILNNDGGDGYATVEDGADARALFLKQRTAAAVGSHVDTIFYCTGWAFGTMLHRTEVGEVLTARGGAENETRILKRFLDQGTDPLREMVALCHDKGIEVFWSMRMNDTHDFANPLLRARMKAEHPEYLLGSAEKRPTFGQWTAVDYGRPEVRGLAYRYIEEVCANYDVDGVEMDFFRHPILFKSHAYGGAATTEELDALTGLVRRVRAMADARGAARGRPVLLAIRVPDSVEYCRRIGIALERWLAEGLTDLLVTGGYFRLNPWEYSVELGHRYGIPVYPSLDAPVAVVDPRVPAREFSLDERLSWVTATKECPIDPKRTSLESWRARAMNAFHAGADGVYLFNMFKPTDPLLREIGDPEVMRTKSKLYLHSWRGTRQPPSTFLPQGNRLFPEPPLNPMFPFEVAPGAARSVRIPVGDDIAGATAAGSRPTVTVELWIQPAAAHSQITAACNGRRLTGGTTAGEDLTFTLDPAWVKQGPNVFEVRRAADAGAEKAFMRDIRVRITYAQAP